MYNSLGSQILTSSWQMDQERGSCMGVLGGTGGDMYDFCSASIVKNWIIWPCLLTNEAEKYNPTRARFGDHPFIIAAVYEGTALFLLSLSSATPQRGLTFSSPLKSQFSAAESLLHPSEEQIRSWCAALDGCQQLVQTWFPVFHKDAVRFTELFWVLITLQSLSLSLVLAVYTMQAQTYTP